MSPRSLIRVDLAPHAWRSTPHFERPGKRRHGWRSVALIGAVVALLCLAGGWKGLL